MVFRCIALVACAILISSHANGAKTLSEEDMMFFADEISKINEGLPKMVDKVTRWDSTEVAGTTVSYIYTLLNYTKENAPTDLGFYLYKQARHGYCTKGGDLSYFRDYEVDLSLYFRGDDGKVIASLMINYDDCPEEDVKEEIIVTEPELGDTMIVDPEWLSLTDQIFAGTIDKRPATDNLHDRLLAKWQNDETLVIIQFLSNGDAHQIEGDKVTLLKYSVPQINEEQRLMLVKIYESKDSVYDLYIQFFPLDQQARVAVVKDGVKTFEKWSYAGRPDLIAIANQYSHGKKPWISWDQILASKEYKDLDNRDRSTTRRNWVELFGNKNK